MFIVLSITLALFVVIQLLYIVFLWHVNRGRRVTAHPATPGDYPSVLLVVPVRNEESVLPRKIRNVERLDYPRAKLRVVFVDNGSTDRSLAILRQWKSGASFEVLDCPKRGKISAINVAMSAFDSAVVAVTDADSIAGRLTLKRVAEALVGRVGGVSPALVVRRSATPWSRQKRRYHAWEWRLRWWEGNLGGTFLDAKFMAFRRDVVPHIPEHYLADDFAVSLLLARSGRKTVIDRRAFMLEDPPRSLKFEFLQIRRRVYNVLCDSLRFLRTSPPRSLRHTPLFLSALVIRRWLPAIAAVNVVLLYPAIFLWANNAGVVVAALAIFLLGGIRFYIVLQLVGILAGFCDFLFRPKSGYRLWAKIEGTPSGGKKVRG